VRLIGKSTAVARARFGTSKSRRDQLLDAAARQLNSKGISMTSITDVADQLGFSRASLYYYVEDREDLMFQVYLRSSELMARTSSREFLTPRSRNLRRSAR
jgi:AcrR family transcriptional regulator